MDKNEFEKLLQEYQEALKKYEEGTLNRNYLFNLGKTSEELLESGFSEAEIRMFQKTVGKMLKKHELSSSQISKLPELLRNPLAIFGSKKEEQVRIVQSKAEDDEKLLAIILEQTELNKETINELKSAYPKENWIWEEWEKEGLKIQKNKKS